MAWVYRRPFMLRQHMLAIPRRTFFFSVVRGEYGVVYRYGDANNYWHAYVVKKDKTLYLDKVVASVRTNVASAAVSDALGEARVIAQGNRHRVWWNFTLLIDETDAALNTNTKAGIVTNDAAPALVGVDNFYAQGLSA